MEFEEGGHVFLKATPKLGLKGPSKTRKLSIRYIRLYQIISRVGEMAYQLDLPPSLSELHDVFCVFQLRKFVLDSFQHVLPNAVKVEAGLSFQSQPNYIMNYGVKALSKKEIPIVKMMW